MQIQLPHSPRLTSVDWSSAKRGVPSGPRRGAKPVPRFALLTLLAVGLAWAGVAHATYVNWEAGHVRPLALSPSGDRLFAVNTPDNHLAIFQVTPSGLELAAEVQVGLRPVAVALRDAGGGSLEAWVVNHLSDSVSIVAVDGADPSASRVVRTLLVGDEPRDVVFDDHDHAYVTTARRGQHDTVPAADLRVPSTPRALVWVFDTTNTGAGIGGTPIQVIELFTDTPRGLAVSPDGNTVYAAGHRSGNRTTVIDEATVAAGGGLPPMPPGATPGWPDTSLIVQFDETSASWEDEIGRDWSAAIPFSLPDTDLFEIDATLAIPALAQGTNAVAGVGTTLFNVAVRPGNGKVYVSNLAARNAVRFENLVGTSQGLQGQVVSNNVTVVDGVNPTPVHLNSHVDYSVATGPPSERDQSLALPLQMVFSSSGDTLYLAAFGSAKVAVLDPDALEAGSVGGDRIDVPGGPSGLALDESRDRLYVMSRFENTLTVIGAPADPGGRSVIDQIAMPSPEPPEVVAGRPFLYDAAFSSGHGDAACGSCHIFGDMDKLAWDLGDPFGSVASNPNTNILDVVFPPQGGPLDDFHPLKGPMTTQSLRGLPGTGPLHWRGDRTNAVDEFDFEANFAEFSAGFVTLLGRSTEPSPSEFSAFSDFVATLAYPPNPMRTLDDVGTPSQVAGENVFTNVNTVAGVTNCNICHALPTGTNGFSLGVVNLGMGAGSQVMKIPHERNMYDKVGAYGVAGPQVSGFGYLHDGTEYSMFDFLNIGAFNLTAQEEVQIDDFQMSIDTGFRPVVGQQLQADSGNHADAALLARLAILTGQADAGNAELVVKGRVAGEARGALYLGGGLFQQDKVGEPNLSTGEVLALAGTTGQEQVFTAVPPGTGGRLGLDRDEDAYLNADDNCPGVANDQTDTDGDGIGDPCDPTPVPEPGVVLAFFSAVPLLRWLAARRSGRRGGDQPKRPVM